MTVSPTATSICANPQLLKVPVHRHLLAHDVLPASGQVLDAVWPTKLASAYTNCSSTAAGSCVVVCPWKAPNNLPR